MSKRSCTGLMSQQHEVHRLENLYHKKKGSAHYLPDYGLDWDFFQTRDAEIPVGAFLSYFNQKATDQGIVVLEQDYRIEGFELHVRTKLLSEEVTLSKGV